MLIHDHQGRQRCKGIDQEDKRQFGMPLKGGMFDRDNNLAWQLTIYWTLDEFLQGFCTRRDRATPNYTRHRNHGSNVVVNLYIPHS